MRNLKVAFINQLRKRLYDFGERDKPPTTQQFSGDNTTRKFTLNSKPLLYVSGVTVGGVSGTLIKDYNIDFGSVQSGAVIEFVNAPAAGSDNISVEFVTGTNWIYTDQPRVDSQMPRASILGIGGTGESALGVADEWVMLEPNFRVGFWARTGESYYKDGYTYNGEKLLDYLNTNLQDEIRNIRVNGELGYITDIKVGEPTYLGIDEEYKIKRTEATVTVKYAKPY